MRDSDIVASIVARVPPGLAGAYDRYADSLYRYCRYVLSDPAEAARAVRDTFVIADARAGGLREPQRLRAWLCAIARGECQRILRGRKAAPGLTDGASGAEEPGLRVLLEDAAWGLDPVKHEVIELQLSQDLEPDEIAVVLGVSRRRAHSLVWRAHHQLQDSVGALLVARAGQYECAVLCRMLADWDWRLTPPLRTWLRRHIGRCATCAARRGFELRSAMPQGLQPGLAVIAAVLDSSLLAAGPPAELRASTLALAADQTPDAFTHRAAVLGRAGVFRRDGFPVRRRSPRPAPPPATVTGSWQSSPQGRTTAGVMLAVAVTAVVVAFNTNPGFFMLPGAGPRSAAAASAPAAHGKDGVVLPRARSTAAREAPSPHAPATPDTPATTATPGAKPTASRIASPTPAPDPTATPTHAPTSTPTTVATTAQPSGPPTPTVTARPPGSPSPSPSQTPAAGTLAVSPPGGSLKVVPGGVTITLTARGGPVDWSTTVSSGTGHVGVNPSSGTLQAGASVAVMVKCSHSAGGRQLMIDPGGTVFTIVIGWGGGSANTMSPASSYAIAGRIVY